MANDTYGRQAEYERQTAKAYQKGDKNTAEAWQSQLQDELNTRAAPQKSQAQASPTKPAASATFSWPSYKKGGIVRKTGLALIHKGERVIPHKRNLLRKNKSGY